MNNKELLFDDFDIKKAFSWILAIEPELWADMFFHREWLTLWNNNDDCYDKTLREEFKDLKGHYESITIREIDNMHKLLEKRRIELIKHFTKTYKGYFTLWGSRKASWWVHFHVFSQWTMAKWLKVLGKAKLRNLDDNLQATLLYNLFYEKKVYWRYRGSPEWSQNYIYNWAERTLANGDWMIGRVKNDYLPGIEYRCNNVFDIRLYWYYIALTILSLMNLELPPVILNDDILKEIRCWLTESKEYKERDKLWRVSVTSYKSPLDITNKKNFDLKIFKNNLWKLLFILSLNGLTKAKEALEEYIKENIWYKIKSVPIDCSTWEVLGDEELDWYALIFDWVKYFSKETKWLKVILRKASHSPELTSDWAIRLSTKTLIQVKLIK